MDDFTLILVVLSCTIPSIAAVVFYKKRNNKKDN